MTQVYFCLSQKQQDFITVLWGCWCSQRKSSRGISSTGSIRSRVKPLSLDPIKLRREADRSDLFELGREGSFWKRGRALIEGWSSQTVL
ncbi:hypothetical protein PPACK8108_LOCUS5722 [Phakopsora pachyrhizi]|uniref:Uncharacterized protein n=1 Tax=Phakopsora pachyrhizi TaxID=170000 RepID=A0AAV0ASC4_PHAPC|nr:hypothetical protein PPACK8108_LOCUS5722 [Phakopsora pachyrhizi]